MSTVRVPCAGRVHGARSVVVIRVSVSVAVSVSRYVIARTHAAVSGPVVVVVVLAPTTTTPARRMVVVTVAAVVVVVGEVAIVIQAGLRLGARRRVGPASGSVFGSLAVESAEDGVVELVVILIGDVVETF